jgi:hypothetical protein
MIFDAKKHKVDDVPGNLFFTRCDDEVDIRLTISVMDGTWYDLVIDDMGAISIIEGEITNFLCDDGTILLVPSTEDH